MKTEDFKLIREKLTKKQTDGAKAEGVKEQIEKQWKEENNIENKTAAEESLKNIKIQREQNEIQIDEMLLKLDTITDWGKI